MNLSEGPIDAEADWFLAAGIIGSLAVKNVG